MIKNFILVFFLVINILFSSCGNDPEAIKSFIIKEGLSVEESRKVKIMQTAHGLIKIKLEAEKVERFVDPNEFLKLSNGLRIEFYNDSLELISVLLAENAILNQDSEIMEARDNVVLEGNDGKKLESEHLIWDLHKDLIFTEERVTITIDEDKIHGYGFESSSDFSSYQLKKVSGDVQLTSNKDSL